MSSTRDAQLAAAVLGMRTPIARVQLAASRLEQIGHPPLARRVADGLRDAVAELDRELDLLLAALAPARQGRPPRPCGAALDEVLARVAGSLRARGSECVRGRDADEVTGDPSCVRRSALQLLRAGSRFVEPEGTLELGLAGDPDGFAVTLTARGAAPPLGDAEPAEVPRDLARFALSEGGELSFEHRDDGVLLAALRFPAPRLDP